MKKYILALCFVCLATGVRADEVADLKIELAVAQVRAQRLESKLEAEPEVAPVQEVKPIVNPVLARPQFVTRQEVRTKEVLVPAKWCNGRVCSWKRVQQSYTANIQVPVTPTVEPAQQQLSSSQDADQYASPPDVIDRVLTALAIQPNEVFLDVGSGDGRAVIAAAKKFGCRAIGIEQDPQRVALAQANAAQAGVSHLVTFIQGDFRTVQWPKADVGYAYLFPEDLEDIRSKLQNLNRFVSFCHEIPGLRMRSHGEGEFYSWKKTPVKASVPGVWYGNRWYTAPVCNRPNCSMCNTIRRGLAAQGAY